MVTKRWKRFLPSGRTTVIGIPFLWLLLFLVFPFAIVFKISFAEMAIAIPPFTELFSFVEEKLSVTLNIGNYLFLLEDHLYISAYLSSLKIAAISTFLALLVGYPIAYGVARAHPGIRQPQAQAILINYLKSCRIFRRWFQRQQGILQLPKSKKVYGDGLKIRMPGQMVIDISLVHRQTVHGNQKVTGCQSGSFGRAS